MLVVVDRLCHDHVLVHEDNGEDLTGRICVVGCSLVKGPPRVEADFTCAMNSPIKNPTNALLTVWVTPCQ